MFVFATFVELRNPLIQLVNRLLNTLSHALPPSCSMLLAPQLSTVRNRVGVSLTNERTPVVGVLIRRLHRELGPA
jgi:hypothetical protein